MPAPKIIRTSKITGRDRDLTVSTVKIGFRYYDTVIFDDAEDRPNQGKRLGDWVIGELSRRNDTREDAMETHRDALQAARSELIR